MASMALHCSGSVPLNWLRATSLRAQQQGGGRERMACRQCSGRAVESKALTHRTHTCAWVDHGLIRMQQAWAVVRDNRAGCSTSSSRTVTPHGSGAIEALPPLTAQLGWHAKPAGT